MLRLSTDHPPRPKPRRMLATALLCIGLAQPFLGQAVAEQPSQPSPEALEDFALPAYSPDSLEVIKSPNDRADYRALRLDNGLEVLLVHDPRADRAGASMDVSVGSAFDPKDMPGLAHFLEHMLFLGTQRYPDAADYQDYLTRHGGSHNAFTAPRDTNFYFDIAPDAFEGALDRFSQFFISPQFNTEFVDRERHAVDSEYRARIRDDSRRINDATNLAMNPEHPFSGFSVGSIDTLVDGQTSLRDRLLAFYRAHYDANVMHLAVVGPQSLDELEALVRDRFEQIPDHGLKAPEIDAPMFTHGQLPAKLEVQTLADQRSLSFSFPVPDPQQFPRERPDAYLGDLLGHEGEGSLLAALRNRGWANALSAGVQGGDGKQAILGIDIELTPEGTQHQDEIQATLFAYLDMLRAQPPQQWRFDEQAALLAQQFRFAQNGSGADRAVGLTLGMSRLPLSEINVARYRMDRFDAGVIDDYLRALTPDNLLRVYAGPEVQGESRSPWFDAPYTLSKMSQWPAAKPLEELALPGANPFIASDFSLLPVDDTSPRRLIDRPGLDLWYRGDHDFGTPRAEWRISLMSPEATRDARQQVLTELLADWLNDSLSEVLYPATLAGQSAGAYAHGRGITLSLSGWRDHQRGVLSQLVDQLREGEIDEANFARIRLDLEDELRNERQMPLYQRLGSSLAERLISPQWTTTQRLEALEQIDLGDLRTFRDAWLQSLHVQALTIGNLSEDDAIAVGDMLDQRLAPRRPLDAIPDLVPLAVRADMPVLRPATDRNDSGALRYLQGPDRSAESQARLAVIGQLIQAPFYTELRTRQQLGYVVSARYMSLLDAPGIAMLIQSPGQSSETLFERMDDFLDQFTPSIEALDDQALMPFKAAVRSSLLERDQSLSEMTNRQWRELSFGWTDFDRQQRLATAVDAVDAEQIKAAWQALRQAPAFDIAADPQEPDNDDAYTESETLSALPR